MNRKLEMAVDLLKNGQSFSVDDIRLGIDGKDSITVMGWSLYLNFTSLNRAAAIEELGKIKSLFSEMLDESSNLRDFIMNKTIEYKLCFDDAGKASIDVCSEKNGVIKWLLDLK